MAAKYKPTMGCSARRKKEVLISDLEQVITAVNR
jgi:hypothetical protein